ncbi:hypothetical protein GGR54DRAFT_431425 [Hypoxylon sp. NC1633]|nr:hypothetical protein GGR54DRAFT_431425 [Hypoxylon sp. NC1633]
MASSRMGLPVHLSGHLIVICSILLLLTSILCIAFKSASLAAYKNRTESGWIALYPVKLISTTPDLLVATASINLIISLIVGTASLWSIQRRRKPFNLLPLEHFVLVSLLRANAILSTATFIYQFVRAGQSSHFDPSYQSKQSYQSEPVYYDKGAFTLETWTCDVLSYYPNLEEYQFGIQCTGERASRVLLILLWIFATAILGLLSWDFNACHVVVRPQKAISQEDDDDDYI